MLSAMLRKGRKIALGLGLAGTSLFTTVSLDGCQGGAYGLPGGIASRSKNMMDAVRPDYPSRFVGKSLMDAIRPDDPAAYAAEYLNK